MNEIIPPSEPDKEPAKPLPVSVSKNSKAPSAALCTFYGFLLFIISGPISFLIPPACLVGLGLAIASLFYKGYRCIFVGYILTIGLLLLAMIAYCSIYPVRFD